MRTVRERGTRRASIGLFLYLGTVVLVLGVIAATAWAVAQPIGATDNAYTGGSGGSAPTYTMDQGERPFLTNNGPANLHNVKARQNGPDNGPLFFSATLQPTQQAPVHGTEYLSAGTYPFFCTIHPTEMQGTLVVTAKGTPQARPTVSLTVKTKTISKALKKGLLVSVDLSTIGGSATLVAKLGKATIGEANFSQDPHSPGPQRQVVRLTKSGKSKLRKKSTAKVTVTADTLFGSPASAKAKLK